MPRDVSSGESARLLKLGWPEGETDKPKQMLRMTESESYANGITKLVYDVVR